jgi:orotate phosphoribosyltransferase
LNRAAKAVRAEGGIVKEAIALLDREEGGKEKLEKNGIRLFSLLKMSEVANTLFEIEAIDEESRKTILKQIKK